MYVNKDFNDLVCEHLLSVFTLKFNKKNQCKNLLLIFKSLMKI